MYSFKIFMKLVWTYFVWVLDWGELKARKTCTYTGQQTHRQISMPWMDFKPWT